MAFETARVLTKPALGGITQEEDSRPNCWLPVQKGGAEAA